MEPIDILLKFWHESNPKLVITSSRSVSTDTKVLSELQSKHDELVLLYNACVNGEFYLKKRISDLTEENELLRNEVKRWLETSVSFSPLISEQEYSLMRQDLEMTKVQLAKKQQESTQCQLEREEATARHESERKHSNEQNAICWEQAEDTKLRLQTLVERITKEKEDFKRRWESKVDENASLRSSAEEWRKQMQHTYDENLRLANERNEELLGNQNKEWERKYILLQAELNTTRNELSDSRKKVRELQILVQEQTKASTNRLEKFESCQNLLRKQKEDYERKVQVQEEHRKV